MNSALEFHDSTVGSAQVVGDSLRILFSAAYVHRSIGRPGVDSGDGCTQSVEMSFGEASFTGSIPECVGNLANGSLVVPGEEMSLVPIPFNSFGPVRAELEFADGSLLTIEASSVSCSPIGEPVFVEHFRG